MIVDLTYRGWWTTFHGVVLGGFFILSLSLVLLALPLLREDLLTPDGAALRLRWLRRGLIILTVVAWSAAVTGTFVVDPWFHQHVTSSPLEILEAHPSLTYWTDIVMEWKERIAWTAALVATAASYICIYYRDDVLWDRRTRMTVVSLFGTAFGAALAAGVMGMLLTKLVPVT